jgi:hypothetical protein
VCSSDLHRLTEDLPSFGPWSDVWGYGVYSPWKALLYAYGFGTVEAKDKALGAAENPEVVFSDHFRLRGDLFIPAEQTLRVSPLATIVIDSDVTDPEGPDELGIYDDLQEIRVAGNLVIETSLTSPFPEDVDGVGCTIVIDDGGVCTVTDGGQVTCYSGQILHVREGGELNLEEGGRIVLCGGSTLLVEGGFNLDGGLIVQAGAQVQFNSLSAVSIASDLTIPAGATFTCNGNVTTVAAIDLGGTGSDPSRVEIVCYGRANFNGSGGSPVYFKGVTSGIGKWAGIDWRSTEAASSTFNGVHVYDANIGLSIGGSAPVTTTVLVATRCSTGIKVANRNNVTLSYGEITACETGVSLDHASINIDHFEIISNTCGIKCATSSPLVRDCSIYGNTNGVFTLDSSSIPNLGTTTDHGDNDFYGPVGRYPGMANTYHIVAQDPASDIYARYNWWGTTNTTLIQARIIVIDAPPLGAGSVIFTPVLAAPPGGGGLLAAPINETEEPANDQDNPTAAATYLSQNAPNPFNPTTMVYFGLEQPCYASVKIFNAAGQLVKSIHEGQLSAGVHAKLWDGTDSAGNKVPSGVYFYCLEAGAFKDTKKMVLLR